MFVLIKLFNTSFILLSVRICGIILQFLFLILKSCTSHTQRVFFHLADSMTHVAGHILFFAVWEAEIHCPQMKCVHNILESSWKQFDSLSTFCFFFLNSTSSLKYEISSSAFWLWLLVKQPKVFSTNQSISRLMCQ